MSAHVLRGAGFLVVMAIAGAVASLEFRELRRRDTVIAGTGVTSTIPLSRYHPALKGTSGDADVYVLDGADSGATVLVLGGTHPNEASGFLSAVLLVENAVVTAGRLFVIPQASASGYTCTDPLEAYPQQYEIPLPDGGRRAFRFGSRGMNPIDQWPDPLVYLHHPSGQRLSGIETRNLNRAFPGRPDGSFTEQVAYAIMELIRTEQVDLAFDLHEAAPEYPVINAIVTHDKGKDIAAMAMLDLEMNDLQYTLELSPERFRGLSHREWGDSTEAIPFLMETGNIVQGRLRGRTTPELILTGKDPMYLRAAAIGLVKIPYDSAGVPIAVRVGRHLEGLRSLMSAFNDAHPDVSIHIRGIPSYEQLQESGIGRFLSDEI